MASVHLLIPVDTSCLSCSMKDEMTADHRGEDGMPLPRGRQQLESSGGLNLPKGPGEVIQLFGGKGKDDLSLCGHSHLVSTAVSYLT